MAPLGWLLAVYTLPLAPCTLQLSSWRAGLLLKALEAVLLSMAPGAAYAGLLDQHQTHWA